MKTTDNYSENTKKAEGAWKYAIAFAAGIMLTGTAAFGQAVVPGVAPMNPPSNGFGIDGDLKANLPTAGTGDWLPNGSPGESVLSSSGAPLDTSITFHALDLFNPGDDIFGGGQKKNDNPNQMSWKRGNPSPAKNDINHFLMHVAKDQNNDTWIVLSGDREVTNGNSFLSLQFLQKTLTQIPNNNPATQSGTFSSEGIHGGRTIGDLQVSAEFINGGGNPNLYLERWEQVGSGYKWVAYDFFEDHPNAAYGAVNSGVLTNTNYLVFGGNTYQPNAFMEVAINISEIVRSVSGDACLGKISTLWAMTKSSQAESANLTDFVTPLQINLDINIDLTAANPDPVCDGTIDLSTTITSDTTGLSFLYYDEDPTLNPAADTINKVVSTSGTYYIKAFSQSEILCNSVVSVVVSIEDKPAAPVVQLYAATLCDTIAAPKLEVLCPEEGVTYTLKQWNVQGERTITYNGSGSVIFYNLQAGKKFNIVASRNGCESDSVSCTNYMNFSCQNGASTSKVKSPKSTKTEIKNLEAKDLVAYPVPFSDKVTLEFTSAHNEEYVINLYDMKGNLVKQLKAGHAKAGELIQVEVNGNGMSESIYLARKVSNSGVSTVKLLKNKLK